MIYCPVIMINYPACCNIGFHSLIRKWVNKSPEGAQSLAKGIALCKQESLNRSPERAKSFLKLTAMVANSAGH